MEDKIKSEKNSGAFKRSMHIIFVRNIGCKVFAVLFGTLIWLLVVAL